MTKDTLPVERALGVQWCIETDSFGFKIQLPDKSLTRRGILSMVSSLYDPLGMVAPVILPAKQILQELSRLKLGWDEKTPESLKQKWSSWLRDLGLLVDYKVKGCLKPDGFGHSHSAAAVAVRMDRMMPEEIELPLEPSVFWTDSTSVLKYI